MASKSGNPASAALDSGSNTPVVASSAVGVSQSQSQSGSTAAANGGYDYSAYYAQQGYTPVAATSTGYDSTAYSSYTSAAAGTSGGYSYNSYPAYDATGYGYGAESSSYASGSAGGYGITDEELAAQQSIYNADNAAQAEFTKKAQKGQARRTVLRKGAGEVWEDATLMEWDPSHFRLFIGDLGNDVNDDTLIAAFGPDKGWPSFVKAKVVRDKVTNKTRGYGFVSYSDPEDFMKAWKAMNGKYVGSRPVKIQKASTGVRQVDIGQKKAKDLDTKKKKTGPSNKVRGALQTNWSGHIRR